MSDKVAVKEEDLKKQFDERLMKVIELQYCRLHSTKDHILPAWRKQLDKSSGMYGDNDVVWLEVYKKLIDVFMNEPEMPVTRLCDSAWGAILIQAKSDPAELQEGESMYLSHDTPLLDRIKIYSNIVIENGDNQDRHFTHWLG